MAEERSQQSRPQAAQAVRDGEARLQAIVDTAVDGIITIDAQGIVETMNPAAERIFGYAALEIIGRNISRLMPEPYRSEHDGYVSRYLRTGERKVIGIGREVLGQRKDGSTFPMELSVSEMHVGGRRMFTGIVRDISERKNAEARQRQLATLLQDSNDAIKMVDLQGRVVSWNHAAEQMYGYTEAEALSMGIRTLLPEARAGEIDEVLTKLLDGSAHGSYETQRVTRDGRMVDIWTTVTLVLDEHEEPVGLAITDRDITGQKQARAALQDSEAKTRAVVETAVDGIITIHADGIIESVNPAAEKLFGYRAEEMVGQNVKMLMPEPYRGEHDGYLRRYMLTGHKKIIGIGREVVGRRSDGREFPMELSISEVRFRDERMFTGIVRDISERKNAEESLRTYATEVEKTNEALLEANGRVRGATEAKSTFLANMSHEIRTPLTAVLGYCDLLIGGELDPEQALAALQTIRRNGAHLLSLVNEILDLSKIEAGHLEVVRERVSLVQILQDVEKLVEVRLADKDVEFRLRAEGPLPELIDTDPGRLRQILINLLGNAAKFTERGSVELHVSLESGDGGVLCFDVIDTGVGLDPAAAEKIFVPFTQADAATAQKFGGTGLGLSISRRLAALLEGDLSLIRSAPGEGSHFRVWIHPGELEGVRHVDLAELRAAGPAQSEPRAGLADLAGRRVLVAEDGSDNQLLLRYMLEAAGAAVDVVGNGQEVLDTLAAGRHFDAILMDMQMPVLDGYQCAEQLQGQNGVPPIIAVTADAMTESKDRCLRSGCTGFVSKPIDRAALLDSVRRLADG